MPKFGIRPDEDIFHVLDPNGKMKCKKMRPGDLKDAEKHETFGRKICPDCKTDPQVQTILDEVEG